MLTYWPINDSAMVYFFYWNAEHVPSSCAYAVNPLEKKLGTAGCGGGWFEQRAGFNNRAGATLRDDLRSEANALHFAFTRVVATD